MKGLRSKNFYFIISLFTFLLFPLISQGVVLFLMPQSQNIYERSSFVVEINLDSEGEEINTVKARLRFPSEILEVIDFSKGGSILTLWAQEPTISEGEIVFTGGIPGGFKGSDLLGKITFSGASLGEAEVIFQENECQVLLNDGKGTQAPLSFSEGSYKIVQKPERIPEISSPSHLNQNNWYSNKNLHLKWDLIEGVQYSYVLSYSPLAEPDDVPDRPEGELVWLGDMEYKGLEDGIYYFFLKEKLPDEDWSEKIIFRAMIDASSPESLQAEVGRDSAVFDGKYFLSFVATDRMSGIDHYEVLEARKIGFLGKLLGESEKEEWKISESPYLLEDQNLKSRISVKAIDKAGNIITEEVILPVKPVPYWIIILILVGLAIIIWITYKILKFIRLKK